MAYTVYAKNKPFPSAKMTQNELLRKNKKIKNNNNDNNNK